MLLIDFSNIFRVSPLHGLSKREFFGTKKLLKPYLSAFLSRGEQFHEVIDDTKSVAEILQFTRSVKGQFAHVVVLGIGGSALGASCLQQALTHLFTHKKAGNMPELFVLDNIDPILLKEIEDVIDLSKTLFVVVSKSGETPETISQFLYFSSLLKKKKLPLAKQVVVITDTQKGVLKDRAARLSLRTFHHPSVGGRFSVLSVVGLLPAALIGIDIKKLLVGARAMRDRFLSLSFQENLPFQLAAVQYALAQKGKTITVLMPYAQKLIGFTDWYRQLLAESTGKALNRNGQTVHVGLTPIRALGATDQHSQTQLIVEGPRDKLIIFMSVEDHGKHIKIPGQGISFQKLFAAEQEASARAYTKYHRPNITICISRVDETHLGQLFFLCEGATAFLGEFFHINAFNQPGVELSKNITKELLI